MFCVVHAAFYFSGDRVEPFDPKLAAVFKKVTASVSQVSRADAEKLWLLLHVYGGQLRPKLNAACTHLICGKASGVSPLSAFYFPESAPGYRPTDQFL